MLWVVQWALAAVFVLFGLYRVVDAASAHRRGSVASGGREPLFSRGDSFGFGMIGLLGAVGLVSPALPIAALHLPWLVPAAALLLLVAVAALWRSYGYRDPVSWVLGLLLLAVLIVRGWPLAFPS